MATSFRQSRRRLGLVSLALAVVLSLVAGAAATGPTGKVTVFWGRNPGEDSLHQTCDTGRYTTVIIAFENVFGTGTFSSNFLGPIFPMGDDIKYCQSKGVRVLLSIGGPGPANSLPFPAAAAGVADYLWNTYLSGAIASPARPFGTAVLDGIDFYVGNIGPQYNYEVLANKLAWYKQFAPNLRPMHLTATAPCKFPDPANSDTPLLRVLNTGNIEGIHVRFYGDPSCSYNTAGLPGVMAQWDKWTKRYPTTWVYFGLVAGPVTSLPSPFVVPLTGGTGLPWLLNEVQKSPNYGGVMLWDRYRDMESNYGAGLRSGLA